LTSPLKIPAFEKSSFLEIMRLESPSLELRIRQPALAGDYVSSTGSDVRIGFESARLQPCRKHCIFVAAYSLRKKLGFVSGHRFFVSGRRFSDAALGAGTKPGFQQTA
jgi:hypothetical protein